MRERGHGVVVNLASAAAHLGVSDGAIYAILKAAVAHYTRCLAKELMDHGVRVNAVSPGPTKTARFQATRTVDPAKMDSRSNRSTATPSPTKSPTRWLSSPARAASSSTARCCASTAASRCFRVEFEPIDPSSAAIRARRKGEPRPLIPGCRDLRVEREAPFRRLLEMSMDGVQAEE